MEKRDIRWEELFFDIIFVVGINTIMLVLEHELNHVRIPIIISSITLFLIIFNAWIRVVMLENKIKLVERKTDQEISPYSGILFWMFLFIIITIYSYYDHDYYLFIYAYTIVVMINARIFGAPIYKIIGLIILSLTTVLNLPQTFYITALFIFVLVDTIVNYNNLNTLTNNILSRGKNVSIEQYLCVDLCYDLSKLEEKIYVPHIIKRLGILMIIFMAEYVLGIPTILSNSQVPVLTIIVLMVIIFYYFRIFFSMIDFYDYELWEIKDKHIRYVKTKKTIYITVLYYFCIMMMILLAHGIFSEPNSAYGFFAFFGILSFTIANHLHFSLFNNVIKKYSIIYYMSQLAIISISIGLITVGISGIHISWYLFVFVFNYYLLSKVTNVRFQL